MSDFSSQPSDFLEAIDQIIHDQLSDEKFGVSELANAIAMSRSNLLRRIKKETGLSASQYIRKIRLQQAMGLLESNSLSVSEISYRVGFSSPSYFIKCFKDEYSYPPGEAYQRLYEVKRDENPGESDSKRTWIWIALSAIIVIAIVFFSSQPKIFTKQNYGKSIAVLPFKNDSNDSSNVYIVNGLMESILNHLQKIKQLRVISRTSVEKYRNSNKSIPEIAEELQVSYFVEGSGQKIGDRIALSIQLIDSKTDRHLWSEQYNRESKDIFQLQTEVAKNIASNIKTVITPEEEARISKTPTSNLEAYDLFLKGLELLRQEKRETLLPAISYFKKAIELDGEFAIAYADMAMAYYYLDILKREKKYTNELIENADKAMLYDAQATQSLIAKALSYMAQKEYQSAIPYFEKALEYNPNSAFVINYLSDFYAQYQPDTEKYLKYALKGMQVNIAANDSITQSFVYLHLSNAFIQSGFKDKALKYADLSLAYHPQNLYSEYLRAYVLLARDGDYEKAKAIMLAAYHKDETRLDILQEIAKICYYERNYEEAYQHYRKFLRMKQAAGLDIYRAENLKIAVVYKKMGKQQEANKLLADYKDYVEKNPSVYTDLGWAAYYAYLNDTEVALERLEKFVDADQYFIWVVLFLDDDPLMDSLRNLPRYKNIIEKMNRNFEKRHLRIQKMLKQEGLI